MTRQEAIRVLQNEVACAKTDCFLDCDSCDLYVSDEQVLSAHDMAICALRQDAAQRWTVKRAAEPLSNKEYGGIFMDKYIGTKLIEAEPAFRVSNEGEPPEIVTDFGEAKDYQTVDMGYRVRYADGYESWSPANVFERAYLKMTVNPHLKTDKPSISQEMVDDFIVATEVTTMGDKCTVVRAVLRNGFEIVESSACVSAENYDEKLGADICMEKIKDKVWFLLGFLLQTAVHGI